MRKESCHHRQVKLSVKFIINMYAWVEIPHKEINIEKHDKKYLYSLPFLSLLSACLTPKKHCMTSEYFMDILHCSIHVTANKDTCTKLYTKFLKQQFKVRFS